MYYLIVEEQEKLPTSCCSYRKMNMWLRRRIFFGVAQGCDTIHLCPVLRRYQRAEFQLGGRTEINEASWMKDLILMNECIQSTLPN